MQERIGVADMVLLVLTLVWITILSPRRVTDLLLKRTYLRRLPVFILSFFAVYTCTYRRMCVPCVHNVELDILCTAV